MNVIFKLPKLLAARLKKVSAIEGVSADAIVRGAIAERLRYLEWKERAIAKGDADINAGRVVTTYRVVASADKHGAKRVRKSHKAA